MPIQKWQNLDLKNGYNYFSVTKYYFFKTSTLKEGNFSGF